MNWLQNPEVLSLTVAALTLIVVLAITFAYGAHYRLAWLQLPAAARDAELAARLMQREAELIEKDAKIQTLDEKIRDREAKLLERDQLENEAEYWRSQLEALKAEYAGLEHLKKEIEEVREAYRQAQEELSQAEVQVREARGNAEEARNRAAEAERKAEEAGQLEAKLLAAQQDLSRSIGEQEARFAAKSAEATAESERLAGIRLELGGAERQLEALASRRSQIEAEVDKGEKALNQLSTDLEKAKLRSNEIKETQGALEKLTAERAARQEAVNSLQSMEAHLTGRVARLTDEAEAAKDAKGGDDEEDAGLTDLLQPPASLATWRGTRFEPVHQTRQPEETETAALARVVEHLRASQLVFDERTIHAFHTCLKTAVISPLTVLAGISGTGKSQLPRFYADAMGIHFLKIPVQPRWDGPQDLFGFYNYIEKEYKATDLARALVHLDLHNWRKQAERYSDHMMLVLLDEMNLARVEYYFSEFLSRLEGRPFDKDAEKTDVRRPSEIEIDIGRNGRTRRVFAGQNVLFVGTMNEDESTLSLSDKVLDRANMLRFPKPKDISEALPRFDGRHTASGYLPKARWMGTWMKSAKNLDGATHSKATSVIADINAAMDRMGRPFGHRMGQAMLHYVANYPLGGDAASDMALADQIELRILPRLRGLVADDHAEALAKLSETARTLHDVALADAIEDARRRSSDTSGLFTWRGLSR